MFHLNLPGYEAISVKLTAGRLSIHAVPTTEMDMDTCACGGRLTKEGLTTLTFTDVPEPNEGRAVDLCIRLQRYKCSTSGEKFRQRLPGMANDCRMTVRALRAIENATLRRTQSDTAVEFGISEATVGTIQSALIDRLNRGYTIQTPWILGIDEKRIEGVLRTTLVDLGRAGKPLLDVLVNHSQKTLVQWLRALPYPHRIQMVVMDGAAHYQRAVRLVLGPSIPIVLDRFHVQREVSEARKNPACCDAANALARIYNDAPSPEAARVAFLEWMEKLTPATTRAFQMFLRTWESRKEDILGYFERGDTTAAVEWRNGRIKLIIGLNPHGSFELIRAKSMFGHLRPHHDLTTCDCCGSFHRDNGELAVSIFQADDGTYGWKQACTQCAPDLHLDKSTPAQIWPTAEFGGNLPPRGMARKRAVKP